MTATLPPAKETYCLWEHDENHEFKVGIVGTGPGFMLILDFISNEHYREFMPPMSLVAVAEVGDNEARRRFIQEQRISTFDSCAQMLAVHPEINLVVELTGSIPRLRHLRQGLPSTVSLIDHVGAIFLCGLHNMLQVSSHCQKDLSQQRALLQAIIDEVREDVMLLDKEGRVIDANKNVARRTGKDKSELVGKPCSEVQTLEDGRAFCPGQYDAKCPFLATRLSKGPSEAMLTRVDEDGRLLYFRVYAYPICNPQGRMTHIMVMRRDITARTRRERQQQQSEKLSIIGEMSTYLAHEIRNPLFAIGGFTNSLLKSPTLGDKDREKLTIIAEETARLDRLLTSVLNFARPGKPDAEATCDLAAIASETAELMSIGYAPRGIDIRVTTADNLPKVHGEAEIIKQCLVNLIKNSIEAMEHGGRIEINASMQDDYAALTVSDTGAGMSDVMLERVFSPFFSTKEKGYGLGMAMIKKMVEEIDGQVEISSIEHQGTRVTLRFRPVLAEGGARVETTDGAPEFAKA